MKIFVTVGNSRYDSLVQAIDTYLANNQYDVTIQIADGGYIPQNHDYIRYTEDIEKYFDEADLVITHAGAGTVFHLLESQKNMLVIPNQERLDKHQLDLTDYLRRNNLAIVCYQLQKIKDNVSKAFTIKCNHYERDPFTGYSLINKLINSKKEEDNTVGSIPLNLFNNMEEALNHIISDNGQVTSGSAIAINPEKIVKSFNDPVVKDAIMSASIRYADGIGVVKTLARKTKQKVSRIPGCELWEAIMKKSGEHDISVYLIGATQKTIEDTKEKLKKEYNVNIIGIQNGYFDKFEEIILIDNIKNIQPQVVTVALGSPRQELFIKQCQAVSPKTFFMGVGGTYDVYTQKANRAPKIFRQLNLEWFYRLVSQPKRLFRQTNLLKYLCLELTRRL